MARDDTNNNDASLKFLKDKDFKKKITNIDNLLGQANLMLYGTDRNSDIESLDAKFQDIINKEVGELTNNNKEDMSSFIGKIISTDNKMSAKGNLLSSQMMSISGDDYSTMQSFIYDAYRNRLLEQSDLHEVASQLIELSEAILITRDAIISPDVVEGTLSRNIKINNSTDEDNENYRTIIENTEKKFDLLNKIKKFIIPKTLEYGEYYVYTIPYSKFFTDFMKIKGNGKFSTYHESTLMESFNETRTSNNTKSSNKELNMFIESTYNEYIGEDKLEPTNSLGESITKESFTSDMKNMLNNIKISNNSIPLPILEEGIDSIEELKSYMENHNGVFSEADDPFRPDTKSDMFNKVSKATITKDGVIFDDDKKIDNDFKDIKDCYIKMIDPTKIIPLKIMDTVLGYYYVEDEDISPLSGAVSSTLYYSKFEEHRKEKTVVDAIAGLVVKNFNKKFLIDNIKFKNAIIDCIEYYNLNEKRLKFQFIPAEYIHVFKIDEDENGNGTSMIKKSLFYAKLYLMLLLFKIMSIILYSNDQKVNYVRQSGIDKNLANKVQEIARIKQSRQINITDLFSYTTLINKVGNGSEMYIPMGRGNERPIETEILSGQDIQLNSELMEMLKNSYILATGVPAAIINYLNEADFAKTQELNNTKYQGRVISYQLDLNPAITEWYKSIFRSSTDLPDNVIDNFQFILQPPKNGPVTAKGELINQVQTLIEFLTQLYYEDPQNSMDTDLVNKIRIFRKEISKDQLPMLNWEKIDNIFEDVIVKRTEELLTPKAQNGDDGDDGLGDIEAPADSAAALNNIQF